MPITSIKTTASHAAEHDETEVPLPLATRYGGFGVPLSADQGDLIYGSGGKFDALAHPGDPDRVLVTGEGNTLGWSKYSLVLAASVKLDQSLHRASSPFFARLGVGRDDGGKVWLQRPSGETDFVLNIETDVTLDQNLSQTSDVLFKSVRSVRTTTVVLNLPTTDLKPEEAKKNAVGFIAGMGLAYSDGQNWIPISGNLKGEGKTGRLGVFSDDHRMSAATSLTYVDGRLGVGVGEPQAALHVGEGAIFEKGVTLGTIDSKAKAGTFGVIDGKPAFLTSEGVFNFGSGNGNLKGKGKAGHLAVFDDSDDLSDSHVFVNKEKKALCSNNIITSNVETENLSIGKTKLTSDDKGRVYVDGKALCLEFKVGAIQGDFMEIGGEAYVVGGNLKIKPNKASNTDFGVAKFSEKFFVRDGNVDLDFDKIRRASAEECGLLSKLDYKKFSEKAAGFKKGRLSFSNGFSVKGEAEVIGSGVEVSIKDGSHDESGIVKLSERDFLFREGIAFLRNQQITKNDLVDLLKGKQDALDISQTKFVGDGFESETSIYGIGAGQSIKLAKASYEKFGVAKFSDDFVVRDGVVYQKRIAEASPDRTGLMSSEHVQALNTLLGFSKCAIYGNVEENFIPLSTKKGLYESPIRLSGGNLYCETGFEAKILSTKSLLMLGAFEGEASKAGAGGVRYERGGIEYSNGEEWVRLKAGGISGTGKENQLSFWKDSESLAYADGLFWDEKKTALGIGSKAPIFSVHVEHANASLGAISTKASGPHSGAKLVLGSNDGALQGQSDELGSVLFSGNGGIGAKITAYAASNWEKVSTPSYIAFAVCPDGQTSPVDALFLTSSGYLGIGVAKPSAPIHASIANKLGISAILTGGLKLGSCETSASQAGRGVIRCTQDSIQVSDGERWRTLAFAD